MSRFDYARAKRNYEFGRKYKPIGYKLTNALWLTYDEADDCYLLSEIVSKYYKDPATGMTCHAGASNRDKYTMRVVARIYQDHAEIDILHPRTSTKLSVEGLFEVSILKTKSAKLVAHTVTSKIDDKSVGVGPGGWAILKSDSFGTTVPALNRMHVKDKQKALNDHIITVRRAIKVRTMLGVFKQVPFKEYADEYNRLSASKKYNRLGFPSPQQLNEELMAVKADDFETMRPILAHALVSGGANNEYRWWEHGFNCPPDLALKYFNSFINRKKEGLRRLNGAVEYVQDEAAADRSGQAEVARGSELP